MVYEDAHSAWLAFSSEVDDMWDDIEVLRNALDHLTGFSRDMIEEYLDKLTDEYSRAKEHLQILEERKDRLMRCEAIDQNDDYVRSVARYY